jgi:hypothetical protein
MRRADLNMPYSFDPFRPGTWKAPLLNARDETAEREMVEEAIDYRDHDRHMEMLDRWDEWERNDLLIGYRLERRFEALPASQRRQVLEEHDDAEIYWAKMRNRAGDGTWHEPELVPLSEGPFSFPPGSVRLTRFTK